MRYFATKLCPSVPSLDQDDHASNYFFFLYRFGDFVKMVVLSSRGGGQEEFKVDTVRTAKKLS